MPRPCQFAVLLLVVTFIALQDGHHLLGQEVWREIAYNPNKAAVRLLSDFSIAAPTDWEGKTPKEKLLFIAQSKSLPMSPLFNSVNDILDNCLAELAKTSNRSREDLIASYLLSSLEPAIDSPQFKLPALYTLLRDAKNTPTSLSIYKVLREKVLASENPEDTETFLDAFPKSVDSAVLYGRLFVLKDNIAQAARKAEDYPTCFNQYRSFIKKYASDAPSLATIATERLDAMAYEFVEKIVKVDGKQWKGKVLTTSQRVAACEDYIQAFAPSTERVSRVAEIAQRIQLADWDATRVLIKDDAADAVTKIKAHLLSIGNTGFNELDTASQTENFATKLMLTVRARRHAAYLKATTTVIADQFPTNSGAQSAALQAIADANQNLVLAKINASLLDIQKELKKQTDLLQAVVANTNRLNTQIQALSTELAANFAMVKSSLDAVNTNLTQLNSISLDTQKAIKEGFADVTAHLKETNAKLDGVVGEVVKVNANLDSLGKQLTDGFEGVKQTIVDVSKKDITNSGFWGNLADEGRGVVDRACDQVSSWF